MSLESQQKVTYESWKDPIFSCIKSLNLGLYRGHGVHESGTPMKKDNVLVTHFERHPELSNHGLRLIVAPSDRAIRHDLMIHVDNNEPSTFDILLVHTSIVETRLSRLVTRPQLREIMAFAPKGSSLGYVEINYKDLVDISRVIPQDVKEALYGAISSSYAFAIYSLMLFRS